MDASYIYEYVLSRIAEDLSPYGFKRSGKGLLFYRYLVDRRIACGISMQKSLNNSPESHSFTFNTACIALWELCDYYGEKLTLAPLKLALGGLHGGVRIGHLCRGHDFWWEVNDEILRNVSIEEYYDQFLHADIVKCAQYLNEQAEKKARGL